MSAYTFRDRADAGRRLAGALDRERLRAEDAVVLGVPRGGVVVAAEVAGLLGTPLDAVCVRAVSAPDEPELHIGAVAEHGITVIHRVLMEEIGIDDASFDRLVAAERAELRRQEARYRAARAPMPLAGRTAVVVDDGVTSSVTAAAAGRAARTRGPARLILAVPVSSREAAHAAAREFDDVVCLEEPPLTLALSEWYEDFPEVDTERAVSLLEAGGDGL